MLHIGCHLSSSKGFAAMGETARGIKADTFAFFTRNPRGSKAKAFDPKDADLFKKGMGPLWDSSPCGPCTLYLKSLLYEGRSASVCP